MRIPARVVLQRLGAGHTLEAVCADAGLTRQQFDQWWQAELASRLPQASGTIDVSLRGPVEILRDRWGIPHIVAGTDDDLFFGFGFAEAADRLWQLDYLRRRALGRLAEILGPEALSLDIVARTVGLNRIAREHLDRLSDETRMALRRFSDGINACIERRRERLPVEFDLLDYAPEPWMPLDSVAVLTEFRWYLTGRLPVIAIPELARRVLRSDALFQVFMTPEAGQESIVPPGLYPAARLPAEPVAGSAGARDEGAGSNNWVVAGRRGAAGSPLLASDPHIAFGATNCWYEAHLSGESFNAAGVAYVGVPALLLGRNERVAWGITNNICSQRDLYQEKTDPQYPGCFLFNGAWEPGQEIVEEIPVRDGEPARVAVRVSRNGPIVDDLLPEPARDTGPVSLRWLGAEVSDEISCALRAGRARSCREFREALRDWRVPTWSFVFADADGHIGYQCVGQIPMREHWDRGYRPGWDPAHQWTACIPFDGMPALADPPSGWIRTANNRTAPPDFPYPLSGTWSSGHRAMRIRQMLEAQESFSVEDFARMQLDTLSLRAVEAVPPLLTLLEGVSEDRVRRAAECLKTWNRRMDTHEVGAAIFETFFNRWCQTVAGERFPPAKAGLMAGAIAGLASTLLSADRPGWFARGDRASAAAEAFGRALDELEAKCGSDMQAWTWGRVHTLMLRHFLSGRGDLGKLLDRGGEAVRGSGVTVCNTGYDPNYLAALGATYRLIVTFGADPPGLWASDSAGTSGEIGSPHYCDQRSEWLAGRHHFIPLDLAGARREAESRLVLE